MELDEKKHGIMSLLGARCELLNCRQGHNQTVSKYKETLKGWADAIRFHGGSVAERIGSVSAQDATGNERTEAQREEIATEETLAMLMIRCADPSKYGTLIADLLNQFVKGKDEYPKNMASAESLLELYEAPVNQPTNSTHRSTTRSAGMTNCTTGSDTTAQTFVQQSATYAERVAASVAGTDGGRGGTPRHHVPRRVPRDTVITPESVPSEARHQEPLSRSTRSCSRNQTTAARSKLDSSGLAVHNLSVQKPGHAIEHSTQ